MKLQQEKPKKRTYKAIENNGLGELCGNGLHETPNYVAMGEFKGELRGDDLFAVSLAGGRKRRGRKPKADDLSLGQTRNRLLTCFEFHWSEIAFGLRAAKSLPALRKALEPIKHRPEAAAFVSDAVQECTQKEFDAHVKALEDVQGRLLRANDEQRRTSGLLDEVAYAVKANPNDARLLWEQTERLSRHQRANQNVERLTREYAEVERTIAECGAYLSQLRMLDFIRSKRYIVEPLSLANAVAALPGVGWRRSFDLCKALPDQLSAGLAYQKCKEICQALDPVPRSAPYALGKLRRYLSGTNRSRREAVRALRWDWYYVLRAVETVYKDPRPFKAIPYRIDVEYRKRTATRSQRDRVLEAEERW